MIVLILWWEEVRPLLYFVSNFFNYIFCLEKKHLDYIDEDEKKSLAIVNLQAMLGDHVDVDKIIELLTQNNWDESVIITIDQLLITISQLLNNFMLNNFWTLIDKTMWILKHEMMVYAHLFSFNRVKYYCHWYLLEQLITDDLEENVGLLYFGQRRRRRPQTARGRRQETAQSNASNRPRSGSSYRFTVNIDDVPIITGAAADDEEEKKE